MYIPRVYDEALLKSLNQGKAILIFGPRRCGKTTLLKTFLDGQKDYLMVTGDDIDVQHYFKCSLEKLKNLIGNNKLLVIDEAQKIENIGTNLKLIVDHLPGVQVIATGSSSFELAKKVGEPLTGRKVTLQLYPIAQMELNAIETPLQTKARLESRVIYGAYPEAVLASSNVKRKEYLLELSHAYLYKDILEIEGLKKTKIIRNLLQLVAFQVGKEVSLHEIATQLGINRDTVERYLDLLEQSFILINLGGFSRNLRKEITKTSKYYFYDNGVRNALINNFNSVNLRDDIGALWENYLVVERIKKQTYHKLFSNNYFWRTYDQQEIDFVEEREGTLFGYEFKWRDKKVRPPKAWIKAYPKAHFSVVHQENYLDFIT